MLVITHQHHLTHRLHCPQAGNGIGFAAWCECQRWGHWFASKRDAVVSHEAHMELELRRRMGLIR